MNATETPKEPTPAALCSSALLAGLSFLTVINLKHSEDEYLNYTHAGPAKNGKYLGWITTREGRPIINSEPMHDTPEAAVAHMRSVVVACRAWENPANVPDQATVARCSCGKVQAWANNKKGQTTRPAQTLISIFRLFHEAHGTVTVESQND